MRIIHPAWLFDAFIVLALSGCGGAGTLYPVSGKVTLDHVGLKDGQLIFTPDKEKGNVTSVAPFSQIKDGSYSLTTEGKTGAPLGWYNVIVVTQYPGGPEKAVAIPKRYTDPNKSQLSVEVVADPSRDAYNLRLKSR